MIRWWIDEPLLLGHRNPSTNELKQLYLEGFRTVISLLEERQQLPNYSLKEVQKVGFTRRSIPVMDFDAPSPEQLEDFIGIVHEAFASGKVVVHCQGGSGRTGTFAAAYWVNKGLSADAAFEKVVQAKKKAGYPAQAVEDSKQEASVRKFADRRKKKMLTTSNANTTTTRGRLGAVCFDFRGVVVDHQNDTDFIPGMSNLIEKLYSNSVKLAAVSSFSPQFVKTRLGKVATLFDGNFFQGSEEGKLDQIKLFAKQQGIKDLAEIAFIDDKPANLLPVAQRSSVLVIGFKGSGKYPEAAETCKKIGVPYAENAAQLETLLFAYLHE